MPIDVHLLALARGDVIEPTESTTLLLLDQALEHRVLHLVRDALDGHRLLLGPRDLGRVRTFLVAHEMRNSARCQSYSAAAQAVVGSLGSIGCEVLAVKGWWSMHVLHANPVDRFTSDVDLVISPAWRGTPRDLAGALGPSYGASIGAPPNFGFFSNRMFSCSGLDVDLHRSVLTFEAASSRHAEAIWRDYSRPGGVTWAGARVPGPELGLAQLAVNYCRDRYQWLYQMDDVRRAMAQEDLDWSRFWELARMAGIERIVTASLAVVAETLAVDLPAGTPRPSVLMRPWTRPGVLLRPSEPTARDVFKEQALTILSSDSPLQAARRLWERYVPDREELPYQLALRGLAGGPGYLPGCLSLARFRVGRLRAGRLRVRGVDRAAAPAQPAVVEVSSPAVSQRLGAVGWSLVVRYLLRATSLRVTLAVLDRVPARRPVPVVAIPVERTFARAGACLGRQIARSQYLRRRGVRSTLVIGVRPPGAATIDAHAWLDRLDEQPPYAVLHRIER